MSYEHRSMVGSAADTALAAGLGGADLSMTVADASTYTHPYRFVVVISPAGIDEEAVLCQGVVGNVITILARNIYGNGTGIPHSAPAVVRHVWDAIAGQEAHDGARLTVGAIAAKGDLLAGTGSQALGVVTVGTDGQPLKADSTSSKGVSYGPITQAQSHNSPDTDTGTGSLHHTLGTSATQAASGNHTHATTPIAISGVTGLQAALDAGTSADTAQNVLIAAIQAIQSKHARYDKTGEPTIPNTTPTAINGWTSVPIVNTLGSNITWANDPQFVLAAGTYMVSASASWEAVSGGLRRIRIMRDATSNVESNGTMLAGNDQTAGSSSSLTQDTGTCIINTDGSHFYTIFVTQTSGAGLLVKANGGASHLQIVKLA